MPGAVKAGAAIAILAAAAALALPAHASTEPRLIDQQHHTFALEDLRGKPLIVTFVAAHCTEACPLINAQFERTQQMFARQHVDARLLTITLDPEHDSPATMRVLAKRFNADPRRWLLASGTSRDVHRIMSAFGVVAREGKDGYADVHTTFVYVFDRRGVLRDRIFASNVLGSQLADELRTLARSRS